ncbi:MAG: N-acetyltransferase family protein [Xanthobacteraceae bacterium]
MTQLLYLPGGERVTVRPAGPQDAESIQAYIHGLSPASRHSRFLGSLNELSAAELHRMTHADHRSERTLIAETAAEGGSCIIGEARYAVAADGLGCEVSVSVAEAWRRRALGTQLLANVARRTKHLRVCYLFGDVLRSNEPMKALARKLGFGITAPIGDARLVRITKKLALVSSVVPGRVLPAHSWSTAV